MSTFGIVRDVVAGQLGRNPGDFQSDTDLTEAGFESLDVIETLFAIEEKFGIAINYNANEGLAGSSMTVGDLVRMVDAELEKKRQTGQ
ncbi:acyl carrier protein [Novosphingobium nitrogenifigens]|uniref:acyl carrier protein n=1 Tax=Novosphingobium nitrogenifigens TaxID=378548 RepID=UPI000A495B0B|nr:acyl carrier protein [Novosphingobium nitrogenifigens]